MTVILTQQVGNEGKRRVCNATCHNATQPKCECICGGRYHGKGRGGIVPRREDLKTEQDLLDALVMEPTTSGTGNASDYMMRDLIGLKVRTNVPFPGGGIKKCEECHEADVSHRCDVPPGRNIISHTDGMGLCVNCVSLHINYGHNVVEIAPK